MRRRLVPAAALLLGVLSLEAVSILALPAAGCTRCTVRCCPRGKRGPCCARMAGGEARPAGAAAWRLAECGPDSFESLIPALRPPGVLADAPAIPGGSSEPGFARFPSDRGPATGGPAPETPPPRTLPA